MSYGIHSAARCEYLDSIRWMKEHHYDHRALSRFIDEIETDWSPLTGVRTSFQTILALVLTRDTTANEVLRHVIRFIEDIPGEPT